MRKLFKALFAEMFDFLKLVKIAYSPVKGEAYKQNVSRRTKRTSRDFL